MHLVIDAHIIKGYFQETVLEMVTDLTGLTKPIFDLIGKKYIVLLDHKKQIENEWRNVVDSEWFRGWLIELFDSQGGEEIYTETFEDLRKNLEKYGFPRRSKDIWYARTAKATRIKYGHSAILTEDLDFYDPSKKETTKKLRAKILISGGGPIAKYLQKKENISVRCVIHCHAMP